MKFLLLTSLMFTSCLYTFQSYKKLPTQPSLQIMVNQTEKSAEELPTILPHQEICLFFDLYREEKNRCCHNHFRVLLQKSISACEEQVDPNKKKDASSFNKIELEKVKTFILFSKKLYSAIPPTADAFSEEEKRLLQRIFFLYECKIIPSIR